MTSSQETSFSDSVIGQPIPPKDLDLSVFNTSPAVKTPAFCSTPNCNVASQKNLGKRKILTAYPLLCKVPKFATSQEESFLDTLKPDSKNGGCKEVSMSTSTVISVNSSGSNEDTSNINDSQTTVIDLVSLSDVASTESSITVDEDCQIKERTLTSCDAISLEDEYLLISDVEEESDDTDKDIESYYHLLDSPPPYENTDDKENTVILLSSSSNDENQTIQTSEHEENGMSHNSDEPIIDATLKNNNQGRQSQTKSTEKSSNSNENIGNPNTCNNTVQTEGEQNVNEAENVGNDVSDSNNSSEKQKKCRSESLKCFLQNSKNAQQHRYPSWLESARRSCTHQQLIELMQTVYLPYNDFYRGRFQCGGRFQLNSLSVNNYRNALEFCGKNPNLLGNSNIISDFYGKPPNSVNKRFAILKD